MPVIPTAKFTFNFMFVVCILRYLIEISIPSFSAMNLKRLLFLYLYFGLVFSNVSFIILVDDKTDSITTAVNDAVQSTSNGDKALNYSSILQTKVCLLYVFNVIIDLFTVSNKHSS